MRRKVSFIKCLQWILAAVLFCGCSSSAEEDFQEVEILLEEQSQTEALEISDIEQDEPEEVVVYVCGEVEIPGVYTLNADSRIYDAIWAAGGMTENAADAYLNQAEILTDGLKIYVPSKDEVEPGDAGTSQLGFMGIEHSSNKISINRASKEELMTLQGIGESKADAIIAYRESKGGFQQLEDLMKVDGIKEGTYEKIKDLISL